MRRVAACVSALVVVGAGLVASTTGSAAQEPAATCNGEPVTISWQQFPVGTTTINGTSGPDVIQGGPRGEIINAGGGADVVCAGSGVDTVDGGSGRDTLLGQDDSDTFEGADLAQDLVTGGSRDRDTADYTQLPAGVAVDESAGVVHMTGAPVNGGVVGIEIVLGTGFDDVLIGRSGGDFLRGGGGNDTIDGRGGSNYFKGGPGNDTVTYQTATEKVKVNLAAELVTRSRTEDEIIGIETVIGSPFADKLLGTDDNDHLVGGGQDDAIKGRDGDDVLEGGGGDDVLFPGPGDDVVDGGANDPVTSSGEHGDLVSYQGDVLPPDETHLEVVLYYFAPTNNPPYASGLGEDDLAGIESARGVGSRRSQLEGNDGPNVLIGGDGLDFMVGRGGNDLLYGLGGTDTLNGDYAGGANPSIFGDDYLDGGAPNGPGDPDRVHGNGGDDTCTGAIPDGDNMATCETIF